ncbi:eukaryotic translation elongation factor 1 epsilon-1-like [Mya arenaria]|uniref:eukaryotic translation elongation factor 1 epsilon-1-like n=1 Tax=Mya arenaria TaxID=6604 RepID=UPI0022E70836|nr:eukaryotic translation elongation factor 1 epsilon-1-like [Mya arenaria]
MADSGDTIQAIASYLGVKCGKITYDGIERIPVTKGKTGTRKGFMTITKHLVRAADKQQLIGTCAEDKAAVDQWLEYRVCTMDRCPSKSDMEVILTDLNTFLADKVYFLRHHLTVIDLALYYGLHKTLTGLTFYDKQNYVHVSRWFNNIQQERSIRQSFPEVTFSKTKLYSGSAH